MHINKESRRWIQWMIGLGLLLVSFIYETGTLLNLDDMCFQPVIVTGVELTNEPQNAFITNRILTIYAFTLNATTLSSYRVYEKMWGKPFEKLYQTIDYGDIIFVHHLFNEHKVYNLTMNGKRFLDIDEMIGRKKKAHYLFLLLGASFILFSFRRASV